MDYKRSKAEILKTYEVWYFKEMIDDLFKGYIRRFMKTKGPIIIYGGGWHRREIG